MNFAIDRGLLETDPARAVTETLNANRGYLRQQILPYFSGRPVADIDRREVHNWFASLRATPVAADRSVPVLSVIMREAEAMGLRLEGSKPCRGIRRYRRAVPADQRRAAHMPSSPCDRGNSTERESLAVSGAAVGCPGEGIPAAPIHRHEGDGTMHAAMALPGNAQTILTHLFGRGLEDDRYVVERFHAMADGDIRRIPGEEPAKRKGRKAKRTVATLKAVQQMRPARTEIIICTGLRIKGGIQIWGDIATGLFCDRKQKR